MTQFHSRVPTRITFPTPDGIPVNNDFGVYEGKRSREREREREVVGRARKGGERIGEVDRPRMGRTRRRGVSRGLKPIIPGGGFEHTLTMGEGGGGGGESRKKVKENGSGREWLVAQWALALILHRVEFIDRMLRRLLRQPLEHPPKIPQVCLGSFACNSCWLSRTTATN